MGFIGALIGTIIVGGIVGALGRAILPGGQDIGLVKTVGLGVVAAFIVGLVLGNVNAILALIVSALVAAGLLWLGIRQGFLKA
ncbi:MAG: GlsB/YeaQ/YmgE family stress response membrane protein [Acidimicrobiia bacterium]|nr:GlsB/YeaQ/YmgE family stress response membrane protein [Acidimicrobiia bacterium]